MSAVELHRVRFVLREELAVLRRRGIAGASTSELPLLFGLLRRWSDAGQYDSADSWIRGLLETALVPLQDNPQSRTALELFSLHPTTRGSSPTEARKVAAKRVKGSATETTIDAFARNEQAKALAMLAVAIEDLVRADDTKANGAEDFGLPPELLESLTKSGVTRFFSSREDYKKYRNGADSISRYVSTAKRSIEMVSINLSTGHDMEEIASVFEEAIVGSDHVHVTVSLLDPTLSFLMDSISPVLGISSHSLVGRITDTIDSLRDLRENRLAKNRRTHLQVWCHRVLPNASAIILDGDHFQTGRVQLETKGFRTGMTNSWGFEVGHGSQFYSTLRDSYRDLIADGRQEF